MADLVLLDTTDMKRKLHGKNEHFTIVQEAVVKIQKFVRGSLSRGRTSDMIQELIDGILSYREIVDKYAAEDEQRVKNQQLNLDSSTGDGDDDKMNNLCITGPFICGPRRDFVENKPWFHPDNNYTPSGAPIEVTLKERLNILDGADSSSMEKSWTKHHEQVNASQATAGESAEEDCVLEEHVEHCPMPKSELINPQFQERQTSCEWQDYPNVSLNSERDKHVGDSNCPSTETSKERNDNNYTTEKKAQQYIPKNDDNEIKEDTMGKALNFPEEYLNESVTVEPGGRGYNRYRSSAAGRNKTRPWRDDTNVFDAY
jgi:hypothetical protein